MFSVAVLVFLMFFDRTSPQHWSIVLTRPVLILLFLILDWKIKQYPIVLSYIFPLFLGLIGLILTNENLAYKEPRIYEIWLPYQAVFIICSIAHCLDSKLLLITFVAVKIYYLTRMTLCYGFLPIQIYYGVSVEIALVLI